MGNKASDQTENPSKPSESELQEAGTSQSTGEHFQRQSGKTEKTERNSITKRKKKKNKTKDSNEQGFDEPSGAKPEKVDKDKKKQSKKNKKKDENEQGIEEVSGSKPSEETVNPQHAGDRDHQGPMTLEAHNKPTSMSGEDEARRRREQENEELVAGLRAQIQSDKEDFENERKDRAAANDKLTECREQLQAKEGELAEVIRQLQNSEMKVKQLEGLAKELVAAKEEIAVKVAQVKQYQKQVEAYKEQVQSSGSGQFEQLYSQERKTNIRLMEEIEQLKERLEHASLAGRTRDRSLTDHYYEDPESFPPQARHGSSASKAKTQPARHVSHDNSDDDLPEPVVPNVHHPSNPVGHNSHIRARAMSHPHPHPMAPSVYANMEGDGKMSLAEPNIPVDPNLTCPVCGRKFRIGEIQMFKQHVHQCQSELSSIV